jgi:heterodisulfide reductase subunit A
MIEFTINGVTIEAEEGSNVLPVALENGFEIPHLCYHDEVSPYGACRLCLVEVKRGDRRRITASCTYPVQEGIQVFTDTEKVQRGRRMMVELMLARCPDRVVLQELASQMGIEKPRFELRQEECILCGLCARVCREGSQGMHCLWGLRLCLSC